MFTLDQKEARTMLFIVEGLKEDRDGWHGDGCLLGVIEAESEKDAAAIIGLEPWEHKDFVGIIYIRPGNEMDNYRLRQTCSIKEGERLPPREVGYLPSSYLPAPS